MEVKGITTDHLWDARATANQFYDGNILIRDSRSTTNGVRFTLAVGHSKGRGAKVTGKNFGKPRHGTNACWHAHRDLFAAILLAEPDAQIRSVIAVYNGAEDFLGKFLQTGRQNIGSPALPQTHWTACDCVDPQSEGPLVRLLRTALIAA